MTDCSVIQAVMPVAQWFTLIAGWYIVDRQNNRRELRKEKRSIIDRLLAELDALEASAIDYHTGSHHRINVAREIKVQLDRAAKLIQRENLLQKPVFDQRMKTLRQAVTMQNFETNDFVSQTSDSAVLASIATAKDNLVHNLETHFSATYR
ncbi:MAG: hypothetical protein EPN21_19470 [Methylococcaceae bacterium]|nr:MAG: hypothetical protein EPN21_19470 [Methylococcaceae bacterium]